MVLPLVIPVVSSIARPLIGRALRRAIAKRLRRRFYASTVPRAFPRAKVAPPSPIPNPWTALPLPAAPYFSQPPIPENPAFAQPFVPASVSAVGWTRNFFGSGWDTAGFFEIDPAWWGTTTFGLSAGTYPVAPSDLLPNQIDINYLGSGFDFTGARLWNTDAFSPNTFGISDLLSRPTASGIPDPVVVPEVPALLVPNYLSGPVPLPQPRWNEWPWPHPNDAPELQPVTGFSPPIPSPRWQTQNRPTENPDFSYGPPVMPYQRPLRPSEIPVEDRKDFPPVPSSPAPPHRLRPPTSRERETKVRVRGQVGIVKLVNAVTESLDFLDVLYYALPKELRPRYKNTRFVWKNPPPQVKLAFVYKHLDKIDAPKALQNFLTETASDVIAGTVSRKIRRNQKALSPDRPVGWLAGPAL